MKEGIVKKEAEPLRSQLLLSRHPWMRCLGIRTFQKTSFSKPDPLAHWHGPENIAHVRIDDESSWALLDNGSTFNVVITEFVEAHSLDISPLGNLVDSTLSVNSFGRLFSQSLGYIIIRIQIKGVQGYDEDQVALVIPDPIDFGSQVPVILGTLTINQIVNVIKTSEIDELSASLNGLRISHMLACY